jgi:hypothetical protein
MATDVNVRAASNNVAQKVTSEGASLVVAPLMAERDLRYHKQCYVMRVSRTPTGADDEFVYLLNGSAKDLLLDGFDITDAGAENIIIASCTGTAAGGNANVPANQYAGSTNTLAALGVTCQDGVDITGLTLTALRTFAVAAATLREVRLPVPIVVPPGKAICFSAVTGTAAIVADLYLRMAYEPWTE